MLELIIDLYDVSFFFLKHPEKTSNASVVSGRYLNEARPSTTSSALSMNLSDEDGSPEILQLQCDTISLLLKVYTEKLLYIYTWLTHWLVEWFNLLSCTFYIVHF